MGATHTTTIDGRVAIVWIGADASADDMLAAVEAAEGRELAIIGPTLEACRMATSLAEGRGLVMRWWFTGRCAHADVWRDA